MALTAKKVYAILKRQISDMEAKLNSPVRYRGTVATADLLPLNPDIGDMYNIESKSIYGEAGMNVAWNGVVWDTMGTPIDMSLYLTKEGADTTIQNMVNEYLENNPIKPGATTEQAQQIKQNKTDIDSLKSDISNKITKFYASNQGETHLADSDSEKIVDMMMYGKSEQVSTTGSQLLDLSVTPNAHRNQYVFDKKTGIYTHTVETVYDSNRWIISSNPNTDMIISCKNIENGMRIEVSRFLQNEANSTICIIDSSNKKATFNTKTWNELTISIFGYATGKQTAEDIMLEKGTEAHSYEPYTGGQPSPSPDYPQEIKSVVNPTVKVCGKNLLQPNLRGNDRVKINIKKGVKLTLIFKNSAGSAGGNLKFKKANGEIQWFEFDKGSVKKTNYA